jgi:serine/threonine-protein kinase
MAAQSQTGTKSSWQSLKGKRLGRYTLVEHLASGGMAEIFLARHEGEGGFTKDLVLKVLQQRFADNKDVVAMFLDEARLAAELRHPSIVDVYEIGEDDGLRFIAMEYIEGKTLSDLVMRAMEVSHPLPLGHAAFMIGQAADGLDHMGDIVHRDISPVNLVVSVSGQTKIIDFGIARRGRAVKEDSGARPGKVSYMSPEQVRGLPLDGRSDIFSLGTILYEITVGRRLWRGPAETVMQRIVEEKPPPPTYVKRGFPPALEAVVQRALEKRPEDRYQTAAQMAEDLEAFAAGAGDRVGNRQVAQFFATVFAADAQVSERGLRRAKAFLDDEGALIDDESDELDFDRPRKEAAGVALARALRASSPLAVRAEEPSAPAPAAPSVPISSAPARLGFGPVGEAPPARRPDPPAQAAPDAFAAGSWARWSVSAALVLLALAAGLVFLLKNR